MQSKSFIHHGVVEQLEEIRDAVESAAHPRAGELASAINFFTQRSGVIDQGEGGFSRDMRRSPDGESVMNTRLETLRRIVAIIREIEATLEDDATIKRYLANALKAVGFYYALPEDMHDNWWLRVRSMPSRVVKNDFLLRISIV